MNLTDLVTGGVGSKATSAIANLLNIEESKAKWLVAAAVPLMIAALNYNSKKGEEQEAGINKALDQHSGGILDQIGGLLGQGPSDDDNKIVNHMFGTNTDMVKSNLSAKTGIPSDKIGGALAMLAPIVMGYLGKQKQDQSSAGGFGDLLGGLMGSQSSGSAAGGILGSILGSVLGGGGNTENTTQASPSLGGLGDLAGEFFNKDKASDQKGSVLDSLVGMFTK